MIDYFSLGHPLASVRSRYALKARRHMFDRFMQTFEPTARTRVLDLGVTPDVTLPESNLFERLYPHPENLIAASIEDVTPVERVYPAIRFVRIEGDRLPFADGAFDVVFCSAVLEHVGDTSRQRGFIGEALRVSHAFFFTTPSRLFPIEMHTLLPLLHWLPQPVHQAVLRNIGLEFWAKTENLNLLTPRSARKLFPPSTDLSVESLRLFGWPSNILLYGRK